MKINIGERRMNYDSRIEHIMHQYNIDLHHPWFYEAVRAKNLIQEFWQKYSIGGGEVFVLSDKRGDFENFRIYIPKDIAYTSYIYENSTLLALDKCVDDIRRMDSDKIILITYKDHARVSAELARNHIQVVDLYDYFIENGLEICHEYYQVNSEAYLDGKGKYSEDTIYECSYSMLFYDKRKFRLAKSKAMQKYYLEKVIFDCYYMKDFANGEAFIQKYIILFPESAEKYQSFLKETKNLLYVGHHIIARLM